MAVALITGATGSVGRHVLDHMYEEYDKIYSLQRLGSEPLPGVQRITTSEIIPLTKLLPYEADCVYHIAGNTSHWRGDSEAIWRDNVDFTRELLGAAEDNKAKKFVHCSTGAVLTDIKSPYIESKRVSESLVEMSTIPWVIVRPTVVLSKYDRGYKELFDYIIGGGKMCLPYKMHFCSGDEVGEAIVRAGTGPYKWTKHLLAGEYRTWLDLWYAVAIMNGVKPVKKPTNRWILRAAAVLDELKSKRTGKRPQLTRDFLDLCDSPDLSDKRSPLRMRRVTLEEMLRSALTGDD